MIPYSDMPQVIKVCCEVSQTALKVHQWVRVKSGAYTGDLGLVESIQGNKKALVRLVPRMQEVKNDRDKTVLKLVTKKQQDQS